MNSDVFGYDGAAIAYYLPGTTGWSAAFDGLPTALWLPQIVASAVRSNQFSFYVDWASGQSVVVEGCTNLSRSRVVSVADQHAHQQFMVFQRPPMDELSQPLLPCHFARGLNGNHRRFISVIKGQRRASRKGHCLSQFWA